METLAQLLTWQKQTVGREKSAADMGVALRLLRHGMEVMAELEKLRAELAAKTDWRPIATAPTDRWVLVWRSHSMVPLIARYDVEYAAFEDTFGDHVYHVTHWMPLPLPPEESK